MLPVNVKPTRSGSHSSSRQFLVNFLLVSLLVNATNLEKFGEQPKKFGRYKEIFGQTPRDESSSVISICHRTV